ncbi:hypothetical protein BD324DRAFT_654165 [Kockovaella imperatae]|uniref:Uncharacterized protein n=1 Tax=Kockovaella imperatae TaxID=4999 RepID=A0A1Y1U8L3_9TREE|nr:hypothetical protein BD324DRAFT_654165 [Kockovaella imperatae]ORX33455.1 hypothetical protein BD324DRAFT_654165 [Kockovaella imperatae]
MKIPLAALSRRAHPPPRLKAPQSQGLPAGPSCSRWFTCSCCRQEAPRRLAGARPFSDRVSRVDPSSPTTWTRLHLPPSLPYSPESIPFKRHLQALSLALGSDDPDTSWRVYQSLHDDLKRHVSDDTYCALIQHQLNVIESVSSDHVIQRLADLLIFARTCEMSFDRLPITTLKILVSLDFAPRHDLSPVLFDIWKCLARRHDLSTIPLASRRAWLNHLLSFASVDTSDAFEAYKFLASHRAIRGLDDLLHRIILPKTRHTIHTLILSLERLVDLSMYTPRLSRITTSVLARLAQCHHVKPHFHTLIAIDHRISRLAKSVDADLRTQWASIRPRFLKRQERAKLFVGNTTTSQNQLVSLAISHLHRHKSLSALNVALRLLNTVVWDRRSESLPLAGRIVDFLAKGDRLGHSTLASTIRLVEILTKGDILSRQSPALLSKILQILTTCFPSSRAYFTARRLYRQALRSSRGRRWLDWNTVPAEQFSTFLHMSMKDPTDLAFASQLYSDYMADNLRPSTRDALDLVSSVAKSTSASRDILLERHVKDYIYLDLGPLPDLANAMVDGLCSHNSPNEAWMAFYIAHRILRQPLSSPSRMLRIMDILLKHTTVDNVARSLVVAHHMKNWHQIPDRIIEALATQVEGSSNLGESKQRLSLALQLVDEMTKRCIVPKPMFTSLLIREMAQAGELDLALKNFWTYTRAGQILTAQLAATLIIRLAMSKRFGEANEIAKVYRANDVAMRGALAYLATCRGSRVQGADVQPFIDAARGLTDGVGGPSVVQPVVDVPEPKHVPPSSSSMSRLNFSAVASWPEPNIVFN